MIAMNIELYKNPNNSELSLPLHEVKVGSMFLRDNDVYLLFSRDEEGVHKMVDVETGEIRTHLDPNIKVDIIYSVCFCAD